MRYDYATGAAVIGAAIYAEKPLIRFAKEGIAPGAVVHYEFMRLQLIWLLRKVIPLVVLTNNVHGDAMQKVEFMVHLS